MPIRNVLMYVCDALRWDALPTEIAEEGVSFKTVAQSTWSPPCFTTLSTGLYPEQHGVLNWTHSLADGVETVYDIDCLDGAYYNKDPNDRLADVYGVPQDRTIADLREPFFYLERDLITHGPYNQRVPTPLDDYLAEVTDDWGRIKSDYRKGVQMSLDLFNKRLQQLKDRGVYEDTLVIFTADHGEILGEYGDIAHSNPTCPELVYVPTVFLSPSLSADDFQVDPDSEIIEQVDVVQTALSAIGFDDITTTGVDLRSDSRNSSIGYNYIQVEKNSVPFYETRSAWDYDGGHVFHENSRLAGLLYFIHRQLRSSQRHTIRNNWRTVLEKYLYETYSYGDPGFGPETARQFIESVSKSFDDIETSEIEISDDTKEQLKDMGYRV